jgi:lipopolysaccharide export system protein LptC
MNEANMNYKNTLISLIILLTIGVAALIMLSRHPVDILNVSNAHIPYALMDDVTTWIMDKQGKVKMKIEAPKMVHYTENDVTELTTPQLTLYRKSPSPWYIHSDHATASQGIENVIFSKNVTIHHAADGSNPSTLIKTTTLSVRPNQQIAETEDYIVLIQPSIIVKAIGMNANLNTGDIKLLSQARSEYVPN